MDEVQIPPFSEVISSDVIIAYPVRTGLEAFSTNSADASVTVPNFTCIGLRAVISSSSFAKLTCHAVFDISASVLTVHPICPGIADFQSPLILLDVSMVSSE